MVVPTLIRMVSREHLYSDDDLRQAVMSARSWREVLRRLDLNPGSSAAKRSIRSHVEHLGLDTSHFTGQRRWTEAELIDAVAASRTWVEVQAVLGLSGGSSTSLLKGHAVRLGLAVGHFTGLAQAQTDGFLVPVPDLALLPRSGSMLAAAWFMLCGYEIAWPLEPCPHDLVVHREGTFSRVQVKTTRVWRDGSWQVGVTSSGRTPAPYDPDDLDYFFVIDGEFGYYLIPANVAAGRTGLSLRRYENFRVPSHPEAPSVQPTCAESGDTCNDDVSTATN